MIRSVTLILVCSFEVMIFSTALIAQDAGIEYRVIATSKTSTSEKEINQAADAGFRFGGTMGGETAFGGSEVVTIMYRTPAAEKGRFAYKLLATNRTSTMQKEMQEAGDAGYEFKGQTVFKSAFGGKETVVILERDRNQQERPQFEYRLLATKKTSTMQKELLEAGGAGFEFVGVTVADTAMGGAEVVSILRKVRK
jgi:hypothetical protein